MKCLSCEKRLRVGTHLFDPTGQNDWNKNWKLPGEFYDRCNLPNDSNNTTYYLAEKPLWRYFGVARDLPEDERQSWMDEHVHWSVYLYCEHSSCLAYKKYIVLDKSRIFEAVPAVPPQDPIELIDFEGKKYQKRKDALEEKEALSF